MSRSVLITGCSTGLGLETALYLAERGYEVYATMRDLARRDALDEAADRRGIRCRVRKLDITQPEEIGAVIEEVVRDCGQLYGLVNNAGIGLRGYFEDLCEDEIRQVFEINVLGTMWVTKAALPHMRQARQGRIAIVSSIGGRIASLGVSAYCATKFAQEGFGEALAQEVLPLGVHVSLIEPAIIETERWGSNRGNGRMAHNPDSPYYHWFRASERLADRLVRTSPTRAEDVAAAVHRFLTAKRPRLRYLVGRRAGVAVALRRLLPAVVFDRLYFCVAIHQVTKQHPPASNTP